ncbi:thioredoxin family protein [uncultured Granulicatella sp.]|uniref:thioredoxin family protein n=1 Tax=uncultured Granulicatella sp. TaxID=316089 RepID=UPI0028D5E3FB|nr:thioredoxin family protein [uncultured Granulicatella sp.]
MCKIKSLTKDDKLFSILLICFLLFDYFIAGNSLLWLLYEIFVATGIYYLCCKSSLSKKFSKVTKAVIMFSLVALLIAPPLFIFKNNSWMYRTSEYVRTTGHFVQLDNSTIQNEMDTQKKQIRFVYVGRETCPYCREFAPKLKDAAKSINAIIYYIDTENKTDKLAKFAEQYHIDSIPTLLVFKDGQLQETLSNSSDISLNDLKEFLKSHK